MPGVTYHSRAGHWVIAATVLGSALASIDATVVGIALPVIGRGFRVPLVSVQWVVTAYLLLLASLLVVGGALADMFGRRRVFSVGVVWFATASAGCALAPDATVLIVMRAIQGAGAALLVPGSLAIIEAVFVPDDRSEAIGAWSGLGGVATAAGPLLGGFLISAVSWRWIFLINVPVAVVVLFSSRHIPESRQSPSPSSIDLPGAALVVIALGGITYGLVQGQPDGWASANVLAGLTVGGCAGIAFVEVERRRPEPMVPLALLRARQFVVTNATTLLVYAALSGALFLLPIDLEVVDHYSAFEAGVALLPLTAIILFLSGPSGRLSARIGPRLQMSIGPIVVGVGLALLARTTTDAFYPTGALPGVLVFALGLGITVAPLTATALGSVSDDHAGLASAVNNDVARIGGLIAVAVLPALAGLSGSAYLHAGELAHGFRLAAFICAGWCVAGGLVSAAGIRNPPRALEVTKSPLHCAIDATPLVGAVAGRSDGRRPDPPPPRPRRRARGALRT